MERERTAIAVIARYNYISFHNLDFSISPSVRHLFIRIC